MQKYAQHRVQQQINLQFDMRSQVQPKCRLKEQQLPTTGIPSPELYVVFPTAGSLAC